MDALMNPVLFNSPEGQARFDAAYDELLGTWKVGAKSLRVETAFGNTHVLVAGDESAPPIVLVPGAQGTAAMWGPVVEVLVSQRRLYCVDLIDQVGRSIPTRALACEEDSYQWLAQVLDGLGLDDIELVGNSIGSFIAGRFAVKFPNRVRSLLLTAPAATVASVSPAYILKVLVSMNLPFEQLKTRFLLGTGAGLVGPDDPLFKVLRVAMLESKVVSRLMPRALSPDELARLTMPVLLIQGGQDKVNGMAAAAVCHKCKAFVPHLTCETFEPAGHLWTYEHFRSAGKLMLAFLNR